MLITLLVGLVILMLVLWVISILPLPAIGPAARPIPIKNILYVIVGIMAIVWLLRLLGIFF